MLDLQVREGLAVGGEGGVGGDAEDALDAALGGGRVHGGGIGGAVRGYEVDVAGRGVGGVELRRLGEEGHVFAIGGDDEVGGAAEGGVGGLELAGEVLEGALVGVLSVANALLSTPACFVLGIVAEIEFNIRCLMKLVPMAR